MSKVFLDTNILIYSLQKSDPKLKRKARTLLMTVQRSGQGVISTQVIQEFYVVATRKLLVDAVMAKRILQKLENFEVVVVTPRLIYEAIDQSLANGISFWDGLIVAAAHIAKCELLWTEDLNPGQVIGDVRIENPLIM
jgi:predicted nucleic acid-binding protein